MSIEFWHFKAMSPRLRARKSSFHRHFRDFVRNHVAMGLKFAQQCRHRKSFWIWTKEAQKSPKKPLNRSFLLGIAVHSDLRGGSMSPRLFLQQNTAKPEFYYFSSNCRILRSMTWLAVLDRFRVQIATQGFLVAYTGMFTAEKKKAWMVFGCSHFFAELRLPPRNSPDQFLCFRRSFGFLPPRIYSPSWFYRPAKIGRWGVPQTFMLSALPADVRWGGGGLPPRLFHLLDFR